MVIERSRSASEDDTDDTGESPKKKRRAEALGGFAVLPRKALEESTGPESSADLWQKLKLTKRRAGVSEPSKPLTELFIDSEAAGTEKESDGKVNETEAPIESLSSDERHVVEREIVAIRRRAVVEQSPSGIDGTEEADPFSPVKAIEIFHDKVLYESQPADQAFTETMQGVQNNNDRESRTFSAAERAWPTNPGVAGEVFHIPHNEDVSTPTAASTQSRSRTPFAPYAKPAWPGSTGYYSLDKLSRKGDTPSKEYIPIRDELILENIPGAIVGYLLGRRRGRVNTEKKLGPIQKKLEKQVDEIQEDIAVKELKIQKMAREAREHEQGQNRQRPGKQEKLKTGNLSNAELARPVAPEANQLHGKKPPSERIGHVLVAANMAPEKPNQTSRPEGQKAIPKPEVSKNRIATMSRSELLELSETIRVDNTNLRHIYDTHLVGENGLRQLVYAHMHGGNLKEVLQREVLEHEAGFERDPYLRQHQGAPGKEGLADEQTDPLVGEKLSSPDSASRSASPRSSKSSHQKGSDQPGSQHKLLDTTFVGIIVILLALIALLVLTRG